MVLATMLQLSFRVLAIFLQPRPVMANCWHAEPSHFGHSGSKRFAITGLGHLYVEQQFFFFTVITSNLTHLLPIQT
ncbi:unnamed protein product [Staurois parvus]|uniref:Secreted protein n=1 Tax=Staurois parvus TaxID=386267 RepID=A0ABN9GT37_9NEOB|nr:unnamed protein product [Staurois parvus]